ncbi:MAG: putative lipid II flippase FtsW [Clostridia bacterium]|nr:putative lipid II flippase FtsW [Clostridia bacterium]
MPKEQLNLTEELEAAKKAAEGEEKPAAKPQEKQKKERKHGEAAEFWNTLSSTKELDSVRRVRGGMDTTFLIIVVLLLCYGSIMVFSASYAFAEQNFGNSLFFVKKQSMWAVVGLFALIFFSKVDYRILRKFAVPIFCVSYFMLWLVFVPGIGSSSHGATRWVDLKIISFQPSDIMKFSIVLIFALYISCYSEKIKKFKYGILIPASLLVVVCASVIVQRHVSATVIIFLIGAVMILISGASAKWLTGICLVGASAVCVIIFFTDYASARVEAWLHPETVLMDGGWQPYQSLLAIGSGGFFGVGLGNSYQKQLWLPEPQNDFIFAIVCEELGFVGGIAVIALFIALMWRGITIARRAPDSFSALLVTGLVAKVAIQALLNIAVVTTTIPTTGIALPFFSYGGTALIMQLAEMGIVLSVSRYSSQEKV